MYNIKNLTHRSIKLNDAVSVAPHSAIEFNDEMTSEIRRFEQMGLISISSVKAANAAKTGRIDAKARFEEIRRRNAEAAEKAKAAKKTTTKKSS